MSELQRVLPPAECLMLKFVEVRKHLAVRKFVKLDSTCERSLTREVRMFRDVQLAILCGSHSTEVLQDLPCPAIQGSELQSLLVGLVVLLGDANPFQHSQACPLLHVTEACKASLMHTSQLRPAHVPTV